MKPNLSTPEDISWWHDRFVQAVLLALETAGRDQGGWANCHEVADVLRKTGMTTGHEKDPGYLSMSMFMPWCRGWGGEPPILERRRRVAAMLVDYRLTDYGREVMKRSLQR